MTPGLMGTWALVRSRVATCLSWLVIAAPGERSDASSMTGRDHARDALRRVPCARSTAISDAWVVARDLRICPLDDATSTGCTPAEPRYTVPDSETVALSTAPSNEAYAVPQRRRGDGGDDDDVTDNGTNISAIIDGIMNDPIVFCRFHENFTIGRSFTADFQAAVRAVAPFANGILIDSYRASLNMWEVGTRRVRLPSEGDVSSGTDCLRLLQDAGSSTKCSEDAAATLMAGQVLLVHHVAMMCTSAHSILRSSLLAVEPFYRDLLSQPAMDTITITPILVDTIESLVRRESPIIRTSLCDRYYIVDRSVGLCWSLLSLIQELCDCSVRVREQGTMASRPSSDDDGRDAYTDIEAKIRRWEAWPPPDVFSRFTALEVTAMLLQARLYRIATLLIIHRLRYPLGVRDEEALVGANMIFSELKSFMSWAPSDLRALPIGLPLLVAMLEIKEPGEGIVGQLALFETYPRYVSEFIRFVDLVWDARKGGFRGPWVDLAAQFQMPMLP
ncbi:hypothetical protein GMORB2_1881 [Geosmithia morbida]|uniref:Uncharacterized protein n=1 Tax=Geosmithia morbida TaxID=1094350 RepID=A0A9P5D4G5_9HYPO|nr:uncharacterized protein GMORB2_1881 [Geosmithia morbida]KAF4121474.1 hypothetical protein GMORB2_1881 [Geosmithia morbida]